MKWLYSAYLLSWRHIITSFFFFFELHLKAIKGELGYTPPLQAELHCCSPLTSFVTDRRFNSSFQRSPLRVSSGSHADNVDSSISWQANHDIPWNTPTLCLLSSKWPWLSTFLTFCQPCSLGSLISFTAPWIISITTMLGDPKLLRSD